MNILPREKLLLFCSSLILKSSSAVCQFVSSSCNDCLILTPYIQNGHTKEARKLSEVDSTNFFGRKSHSGFMTVKKEFNNNLFFWFFPVENSPLDETPWIIWLQGGPGISSMLGLFDVIGPIKVEEDGQVRERNVTWASNYSLLFIDNPVGAGFSFTDDDRGYPDNEDDIGAQLLELVVQFLKIFPEMRSAPLFIAGQSYAGKYVPALGIQIHRYNNDIKSKNESEIINLRGISIGNGLIELRNVMHYSELCKHLGILDDNHLTQLKSLEEDVVHLIDENKLVDAANKFNETIEYIKNKSGINIYNFLKDPSSKAPNFEHYVTKPEVRRLIHVGNATFVYNNQHVYYKMLPDFANSTKPFVEELLEHYGVMSYSGQLDLILPYSLSKYMYETLNWSRRSEYVNANRRRLRRYANGAVVGYKKAGGNFVDILVRGAGHQVPGDQPAVAKFIMDLFVDEFK